jgi:predicted amidophosphoribosyltransferase
MTERAQKIAAELKRLGWGLFDHGTQKSCPRCNAEMEDIDHYCAQCGEPAPVGTDTVADIEAALVAAGIG